MIFTSLREWSSFEVVVVEVVRRAHDEQRTRSATNLDPSTRSASRLCR